MKDKNFEHLIEVNIQGRVFVTCQSHGVKDPVLIGYYLEIMKQAVFSMLADDSAATDFHRVLDEQLAWLEAELVQISAQPADRPPAAEGRAAAVAGSGAQPADKPAKEIKKATGYVPDTKSMPERLKDARSSIEHLLENDCVTLKLTTPSEAKKYKLGLLGREPEKAEEELVAALRNVLHDQMRKFIRKHNGGPWATATLQHELRMDITKTRSLRSLVTLARELLNEREEWLVKTKGSLTGRFFGGRVKLNK